MVLASYHNPSNIYHLRKEASAVQSLVSVHSGLHPVVQLFPPPHSDCPTIKNEKHQTNNLRVSVCGGVWRSVFTILSLEELFVILQPLFPFLQCVIVIIESFLIITHQLQQQMVLAYPPGCHYNSN